MDIYRQINNALNKGKKVFMVTTLTTGSSEDKCISVKQFYTEDSLEQADLQKTIDPKIREAIRIALDTGELQVITGQAPDQNTVVIEPFFPEPGLIIFGGGHIAKPLCEFGSRLGFSVTVVDDRLSFANKQRFPEADQVLCESFETCFEHLKFNRFTYVVIVTRGHRYDSVCLREIAKRQWAYAGMIGSRRRVQGVKEQLISEGSAREMIEKVNTPIGLEIGAVTPEEIAISILGQVISYRRLENPRLGRESAKINWTEFDRDVIDELSMDRQDQKAIVTIIATKGSVPRKAGAKMLVWRDGRILGSIGGGCSEGAVIHTARDIILDGGYRIQRVDMTGSVAEDEGMVCGGIMDVLIEAL
ncbi:XdhC family protein [Dehalobacter sp. DCM]|uniref:XdhC/CoxI family protein n=1 Tax=Dehalobacter sp. DCM TaxID=2907827 RepID=UPI003081936A|nr:XdhC family protein [Dehalobacter sp. DCM]